MTYSLRWRIVKCEVSFKVDRDLKKILTLIPRHIFHQAVTLLRAGDRFIALCQRRPKKGKCRGGLGNFPTVLSLKAF